METLPEPRAQKSAAVRFLTAPVSLRSYANLLFLFTAFPLGLFYFILLAVGVSVGFGLLVVVVGLPILALVMLLSWGFTAVERQLAIHLLGADVPPMSPPVATPPARAWERTVAFVANPVAWKGMAYLLVKLPLGIITFTITIFLVAFSGSLIAAPFVYRDADFAMRLFAWPVDSLDRALVCMALGLVLAFVSIQILNGLAWLWKQLAIAMLGSRRYALPPQEPVPAFG